MTEIDIWAVDPGDITIDNLPDGRSRRAAQTRKAIALAAAPLFLTYGFDGTSMTAIAGQARVGVQTVYYHFPTKAAALVGALDQAVDGADRRTRHRPPAHLAWAVRTRAEPDLKRRLFLHVRGCADRLAAGAELIEMLRAQARSDAALDQLRAQEEDERRELHRALIDSLGRALSPLTTPEQATDVLAMVLGPDSWISLVVRARWSRLAWARWAHRTLVAELLSDAVPRTE
ncbi:TetR/AcrR family transcriptional regulator [Cellulomonas sp. NPDC089187]|uniref:TetR/AcrR family transcriptional regulator n=1 Tax=Cellulomonas sp. NPDC089187 TaxID=3154970 RepID=UPI0034195611